MATINLLVVGECGDGKSTLIDAMRDKARSHQPLCGKSPQGVTKEVVVYPCSACDGYSMNLIDTPGVGDHGVTPADLLKKIEHVLERQDLLPGGLSGLLVTTPVPDGRIRLGAQVVKTIVEKGFLPVHGTDKFANVILVGTKVDKADEDEKRHFMHGLDGHPSVQQIFFQDRDAKKTGNGICVMVSKQDYSPIYPAIRRLPDVAIQYQRPPRDVVSQALAYTLSVQQLREEVELQHRAVQQLRREALEEKRQQQREAEEQQERLIQLQLQAGKRQRQEREEQLQHEREMQARFFTFSVNVDFGLGLLACYFSGFS